MNTGLCGEQVEGFRAAIFRRTEKRLELIPGRSTVNLLALAD